MSERRYTDEEWLKRQYLDEGHTLAEVGEKCGVAAGTIKYWVDKFDIPTRRLGYRPADPERYRDEDWLREVYHEDELSMAEIGDRCDCSKETIRRWLDRHGIEARSKSEASKIRAEKYPHTTDAGAEALRDAPNWWDEATEDERQEFREWLAEERTGEENPMYGVTDEDHPQWKDDTSPPYFYESPKWKRAREEALKRDGRECQSCGAGADEYRLHVHHIEPISEGGPPFDPENLVTLCPGCHGKKHGDG